MRELADARPENGCVGGGRRTTLEPGRSTGFGRARPAGLPPYWRPATACVSACSFSSFAATANADNPE